jgi:hypothetical protein
MILEEFAMVSVVFDPFSLFNRQQEVLKSNAFLCKEYLVNARTFKVAIISPNRETALNL